MSVRFPTLGAGSATATFEHRTGSVGFTREEGHAWRVLGSAWFWGRGLCEGRRREEREGDCGREGSGSFGKWEMQYAIGIVEEESVWV